jgi:hypothetical protein
LDWFTAYRHLIGLNLKMTCKTAGKARFHRAIRYRSRVNFLDGIIRLNAGETKNDEAREIPVGDELYATLQQQHVKRRPECQFVCFRIDRSGKALPIGDFRKVWYGRCVKLGLGEMEAKKDGGET